MLRRQMEVQSVSSFSELKSTDYLRIEDNGDDVMRIKIIFSIRFSKCVDQAKHTKETFSKLGSPVVSVNGGSPSPFYVCLTREYHPIIQLEVSSKVLLCWESWNIPYTPKTTGKYVIPLFLCLYNRIHQKEIIIDLASLRKEIGALSYAYYCDFEKRCLKPTQSHINKAFDDGLCILKFEYKLIKQNIDKNDILLSFTITKRNMNSVEKTDLSKKTVDNDKIFKKRLDSDAKYFFDPNDGITDVSKAKEKFDNDHQTAKEIKEI